MSNVDKYVALANEGLSNRKIAKILGVDESSVRRGLERVGYQRHLIPLDATEYIELEEPIVHRGDAMVTADWHVPLYSPRWANTMIETARERELKTLVIAGDFFNMDAISRYEPKQDEADLWRETVAGNAIMRVLLQTFDNIIYLWGNHDARLHTKLGFKLQFTHAMRLMFGSLGDEALERIQFTNLDHIVVAPFHEYSQGQFQWHICHPENYSQIPLSTPRILSDKYGTNIIAAHAHHCAGGFARDGIKRVIEAGGLFDAKRTGYLQRSNTYPRWQNGFTYIENGKATIIGKDLTICM